ncbi:MAG: Tetratricopeptide 2 repeat protein, partial [Chthoniobacter sp.]|nr:Tetratricopeptide 2 repeat protein [Chthoniobacter sp.]
DQDAAIEALEKALALTTPGNWLRAELQSQIIRLHQRYHRTPELEQRWKKHAADNPRDLSGYLQLVSLYQRLGELENERVWLEKLTQLAPKNPDYRLRLARLLVQMDQLEPAAAVYDGLLKEQPANVDFVFERAKLDVQRDATPAARDRIARLLQVRKNDESVRAKALEFYEQNRLTEQIEQHLVEEAAGVGEERILALANFYFAQRRTADSERTLKRLVNAAAAPDKQAGGHLKIAQTLKAQSQLDAAVTALEAALRLDPANREGYLLMGELRMARNEASLAQTALEKAVSLGKTPAEQIAAEQKLFESFRGQAEEAFPGKTSPALTLTLPGGAAAPVPNPALENHLSAMERAAEAQPSAEAWLRIARWRGWNREVRLAAEAAQKALAIEPKSVAAYELMVKLSTADGPSSGAVFHLMKLMEIDPANRASYQRRAGQVELQAGRVSEAYAIFQQLVKESPGNADALTDLALTQQRAERWAEALESWRQVYALSPLSKKKEAFGPLLRALEKLELHAQAAELQLKAIEVEADEREQFALYNDLLEHCTKHGLLEWLHGQFEQRRKLRADDYFTEMALGRVLKAMGNKAAAFEVLADASHGAANQVEALPELIREAEDLRKLDAAVRLQAQLVRLMPAAQPEALSKLAELQEKNFEMEEAAKTWERAAAKFPRDAELLGRAVEFQVRWGTPQRAAELLRKIRVLEPANLKALRTLADVALELGTTAEAEACLEQILQNSPAEPTGPIRVPAMKVEDAGRLQNNYLSTVRSRQGRASSEALRALRSFWVDEAADAKSGNRDLRLDAIRQLAQLIRNKPAGPPMASWIARWRKSESPTESIWALYYAGAGEALLERLQGLMQTSPQDSKIFQAYIWLALQTGQYPQLKAWLQDRRRTPSERDFLLVALGQFIGAEGGNDPMLLEKLFPQGFTLRLWQTAELFASRNHLREATVLGRRVFDNLTTQRAGYGRELAHWHLILGEVDVAREILRAAIHSAGESFDADLYGALRELYLLLPAAERAEFVRVYFGAIDETEQPVHHAITGTLLHGLAGDEATARQHLDRLVELRPLAGPASTPEDGEPATARVLGTAASRRWRWLQNAGAQLQTWSLDSLAMHLWNKVLADEASLELQGEGAREFVRDVRQRLHAWRAARSSAFEFQQHVDEFARISGRDGLIPLAEALQGSGAHARAIEVYRQLWQQDPANPQTLRNLLSACRNANDNETAEAVLWQCANDKVLRANDASHREYLLQLVDLLERKGDLERARAVLADAVETAPTDTRLLARLAQLHERGQRPDLAEAVYRKLLTVEPSNTAARLGLASLLEQGGRREAALALLGKGGSPDLDARLAHLQLLAGLADNALATIERIPPPQHVTPTLSITSALAEKGERKLARSALHTAIARTADPGMSFPLFCKAVELLTPEDPPATVRREMRRLRQVTSEQPSLLGSYLDFAQKESARLGLAKDFEVEINELWAGGTGPAAAGAVLLSAQLSAADRTLPEKTLNALLKRGDHSEVWLTRVATVLETANRFDLVARAHEELMRAYPANEQYALDAARSLHRIGRKDDARTLLERLVNRTVINPEIAGRVAQEFAAMGENARAQQLYEQALRSDPMARDHASHVAYARFQIAAGDLPGAGRTLRGAFANPANREFGVILEWLTAAGRGDQIDAGLAELQLAPARRTGVHRARLAGLLEEKNLAEAVALIESHPEIATLGAFSTLRELAKQEQSFNGLATLLEKLVTQAAEGSDWPLQLARVYGEWGAVEMGAGKNQPALQHLRRAHELRPGLFEIARDLSSLQAQAGSTKDAIGTLESYLAVGTNPAEIEKAQALLGKVKSGAKL